MDSLREKTCLKIVNRTAHAAIVYGVFLVAIGCMGCGAGVESRVSGEVTVDGNPLEGGRVVFSPKGEGATQGATGKIDSSGRYEVQSGRTGGLNAGKYAVTVAARGRTQPTASGGPPAPGKLLTPPKYRSAATTDLFVNVESGSNTIDLELTSE